MNILELHTKLEIAIQLGHGQANIYISDGRDGVASFRPIRAEFDDHGTQREPGKILVIRAE